MTGRQRNGARGGKDGEGENRVGLDGKRLVDGVLREGSPPNNT